MRFPFRRHRGARPVRDRIAATLGYKPANACSCEPPILRATGGADGTWDFHPNCLRCGHAVDVTYQAVSEHP